jgi:DNA polymerase-3 subunit gamma/tau
MSTTSLTAKYRPQTFAAVVGQEAVKAVLSRAAAEDKVAPAYLFSGTRGVGKTTVARIFAKALNCERAPTAEPCNECVRCRQATAGVAVDVIEIDAASHGNVEDARSLKEDVGYAPLEGRYKVFIIDEAHMLSRHAFNALLKTLEEPPPRVTFILATTEPHKFPATIVSRCQHYAFKTLPLPQIAAHLEDILGREGVDFEPGAVQVIARRGAGSVRDGMSLLGQALAAGRERLIEEDVRVFLGLAGQEVFFELIGAVHGRDLAGVSRILRGVLDQGLDLGFFLRELAGVFRNLFLLRRLGEAGLPLIEGAAEDAARWLAWSGRLDAAHVHACWQLVVEGQRRVMTSLEPALALELLLLNLACLPELVRLEDAEPARPAAPTASAAPVANAERQPRPVEASRTPPPRPAPAPAPDEPRSVEGFLEFVDRKNGRTGTVIVGLRQARVEIAGETLMVSCQHSAHREGLSERRKLDALNRYAREYFGPGFSVRVELSRDAARPQAELRREAEASPGVQAVKSLFEVQDVAVEPAPAAPSDTNANDPQGGS